MRNNSPDIFDLHICQSIARTYAAWRCNKEMSNKKHSTNQQNYFSIIIIIIDDWTNYNVCKSAIVWVTVFNLNKVALSCERTVHMQLGLTSATWPELVQGRAGLRYGSLHSRQLCIDAAAAYLYIPIESSAVCIMQPARKQASMYYILFYLLTRLCLIKSTTPWNSSI